MPFGRQHRHAAPAHQGRAPVQSRKTRKFLQIFINQAGQFLQHEAPRLGRRPAPAFEGVLGLGDRQINLGLARQGDVSLGKARHGIMVRVDPAGTLIQVRSANSQLGGERRLGGHQTYTPYERRMGSLPAVARLCSRGRLNRVQPYVNSRLLDGRRAWSAIAAWRKAGSSYYTG